LVSAAAGSNAASKSKAIAGNPIREDHLIRRYPRMASAEIPAWMRIVQVGVTIRTRQREIQENPEKINHMAIAHGRNGAQFSRGF